MRTFTKLLMLAGAGLALVALLPYKVSSEEEAGVKNKKKLRAMTWDMDITTDENGMEAKFHMPPSDDQDPFEGMHAEDYVDAQTSEPSEDDAEPDASGQEPENSGDSPKE